jgi:hypothetical protein
MVDLALLITFFMYHTLSKPQSMSLGLPDKKLDEESADIKVDENRTMTVMLGDDNKMIFYMFVATPIAGPKEITFGKDGLRKEILKRKQSVLAYTGNKDKG